jgi:hypothetical protein
LTRVRKIKHAGSLAAYGLKGAGLASYGLKGAQEGSDYLRLNGGRLGHGSRGFFRDQAGNAVGVRAAERLAMAAVYGEATGTWTLSTQQNASSWASVQLRPYRALATRLPGTAQAG